LRGVLVSLVIGATAGALLPGPGTPIQTDTRQRKSEERSSVAKLFPRRVRPEAIFTLVQRERGDHTKRRCTALQDLALLSRSLLAVTSDVTHIMAIRRASVWRRSTCNNE
jgi:hypothetical protein